MKLITLTLALAIAPVWAQDIKFPPEFEQLAKKAAETVDVTLDGQLLQLASRFLSKNDPEEAKVKDMVGKLKGIYVRSFEFDKENEYSKADLDAIRKQLKSPEWARMVNVVSRRGGENAEVYFRMEGNQVGGLVVLAAEPRELTVVSIIGAIDPEALSDLGGHFGVPRIELERKKAPEKKD